MLFATPNYQDITTSLPVPAIERKSNETISSDIPEAIRMPKSTSPTSNTGEESVIETSYSYPPAQMFIKRNYSKKYIELSTQSLTNKLINEFKEWENKGTENSISHIANIRQYLDEFSVYLEQRPEQRVMLSLLELIFQNNHWESMDKKEVTKIKDEVARFSSGEIDWSSLKTFSRQIYNKKISILQKDGQKT